MEGLKLGKYYNEIECGSSEEHYLEEEILHALSDYKSKRDVLFFGGLNDPSLVDEARREMTETRENFTLSIIKLYNIDHNPKNFEIRINKIFESIAKNHQMSVDDYLIGAALFPGDIKDSHIHSPIESILTTLENLKKIHELATTIEPHIISFFVGGSHAYGPFYSVKGDRSSRMREYGINIEAKDDVSDIDGVIVLENLDELHHLIMSLCNLGVLAPDEIQRVESFQSSLSEGKVDTLSIRSKNRGVEESYHILTDYQINQVVHSLEPNRDQNGIGYFRDFRPTKPSKTEKGYYRIIGLGSSNIIEFQIDFDEVIDSESNSNYISKTPSGDSITYGANTDYFPGVFANMLIQMPMPVIDKDGNSEQLLDTFYSKIRGKINLSNPLQIYRQERMTSGFLNKLNSLFK